MKKYVVDLEYFYKDYPRYHYTARVEFNYLANAMRLLSRYMNAEKEIAQADIINTQTAEIYYTIDNGLLIYKTQFLEEVLYSENRDLINEDCVVIAVETKVKEM
jgi:hypothetical protein